MVNQTEAHIFLAEQRGHFQRDGFRSFRTLNFRDYQSEGREAVGNLLAFNDETLLAQQSHLLEPDEACQVMLIPMVGGIEVIEGNSKPLFVASGEFAVLTFAPGNSIKITNPYENDAVNYLQIRLKEEIGKRTLTGKFDLLHKNVLHVIYQDQNGVSISIGKYKGRAEDVCDCDNHAAFAFIIEGAFEVQNRLLEKRDGLLLKNSRDIEFEALSNGAVILIMAI